MVSVDGVVAGEVRQRGGAELDHALRHQAQQLRPFRPISLKPLMSAVTSLGQLGNGLGPERLFVIVVGRQVRQAADDLQLRLGQVLAWAAPASRPAAMAAHTRVSSWIAPGCGNVCRAGPRWPWLRAAANAERESRAPAPWLWRGPPESLGPVPRRAKPGFAAARNPSAALPCYPRAAFTGARYRCGGIAPSDAASNRMLRCRGINIFGLARDSYLLPANPVLARLCSPTAISRDGRAARLGRACPRENT